MSALEATYLAILEQVLDKDFVPHLPPLIDQTKPPAEQTKKNRSRALGAFAIRATCEVGKAEAARAVVDDFDDYGVDVIYYHGAAETLYLVQSKLKAAEQFRQDEALAFCQGIRKLIKQDFTGFNQNVVKRAAEIEGAFDTCSHIKLVVAHVGAGISQHASDAIQELINDEEHGEERISKEIVSFDSVAISRALQHATAYQRVDADVKIEKKSTVTEPRQTYFGLVRLEDLVKLHEKHGKALYERNIRTFLGHKTDVNIAIQQTLCERPSEFLYLNNGVTALAQIIEPKAKHLKIRGLSIINGAQTIASSARFVADNKDADISTARVSFTLIKADENGNFGKSVTRARNHQNPVHFANFAALDDEQERLRRDLAHIGFDYVYKAEDSTSRADARRIRIEEAAHALAVLQIDPRYAVWLKKEPGRLLDTESDQYKALFPSGLSAFELANAVLVYRYVQERMTAEERGAHYQERLAYKHGTYVVAWIIVKCVRNSARSATLVRPEKLKSQLGPAFDQLRQRFWDQVQKTGVGPLALSRNQTHAIPLMQRTALAHYGLETDPAIAHKRAEGSLNEPYPTALFAYLVSQAPQIEDLA